MSIAGLILAAGKGTRMKSDLPKVLHQISGKPMVNWVLDSLGSAGIKNVCVVLSEDLAGFADFLRANPDLSVALQKNRLGTGDAVAAAASAFEGVVAPDYASGSLYQGAPIASEAILVCAGDIPALSAESVTEFIEASGGGDVAVLGMDVPDPTGYGRLVVDQNSCLEAIVEEKDADGETKKISLVNTGIIYARTSVLFDLLGKIDNRNASGEYYLTDIVAAARKEGLQTYAHTAKDYREFAGVNTQEQLASLAAWMNEKRD